MRCTSHSKLRYISHLFSQRRYSACRRYGPSGELTVRRKCSQSSHSRARRGAESRRNSSSGGGAQGPRSEPSWPRSLYMSSSSERAPPGCYWTALPRRPGPGCGRTGARRKKVRNWTVRPFSNLFHPHFINRIQPLKKSPELYLR